MSMQMVELPRQRGDEAGAVDRLERASEQPLGLARTVRQAMFLAGQVQFQSKWLQQHVAAGTATEDMVSSLRIGIWRIEQRLEELFDELGAQHVELSDLTELLDATLDAGVRADDGNTLGRWSA